MKTAEEFLKERDIPNEVITVQRDGFIEGNRVSFLMEEYAKLTRPTVTEGEKWISVEDRLPERESPDEALPVLVSIGEVGPVYEAIYEGKGEFCRSIYEDYPADITHWMPLPAPPSKQPLRN